MENSGIWDKVHEHACGIITGWTKEGILHDENIRANCRIKSFLIGQGYSVTGIPGLWYTDEVTGKKEKAGESSFFVANTKVKGHDGGQLERDLFYVGWEHGQEAVLIIHNGRFEDAYLIGTKKGAPKAYPPFGQRYPAGIGSGRPNCEKVEGDFWSKVKDRVFAFEGVALKQPQSWSQAMVHGTALGQVRPKLEARRIYFKDLYARLNESHPEKAKQWEWALTEEKFYVKVPHCGYFSKSKSGRFSDLGKGRIKCVKADGSEVPEAVERALNRLKNSR